MRIYWPLAVIFGFTCLIACAPVTDPAPAATDKQIAPKLSVAKARNVIFFVGDGMSIDTVTAARIYAGQLAGLSGEEHLLSFENLPYTALSKTYNTNQQVPDSAGTATAMLSGEKTKAGVIGVGSGVVRGNCQTALDNRLDTLTEIAERNGFATGIISTARITHATPATAYAHSADRNWEVNSQIPEDQRACKDIAVQMMEFDAGDGIEVILGGGHAAFVPGVQGRGRTDDRDLIAEWQQKHGNQAIFVQNRDQFNQAFSELENNTNRDLNKRVLGLFTPSHMSYEADREKDQLNEPSLAEMTEAAIKHLSQSDNGYFLFVEGGRIDHAHHQGNAARALIETVAFSDAVEAAVTNTSADETLIVVTADHGHTLSMGGYPTRGNPILGYIIENDESGTAKAETAKDIFGEPITSLTYANGPGYAAHRDPSNENTDPLALDYLQVAAYGFPYETHSGTDVAIYAGGPGADRFHGVMEQNLIFHIMRDALGLAGQSTHP